MSNSQIIYNYLHVCQLSPTRIKKNERILRRGERPAIRSRVQPLSEQKVETSASAKAERQWYRSVGLRTLTSIIAIPVVLAFVWFGGWWAFAASAIVVILGAYELHTMMLHEGYHPLIVVSLLLSLLFVVAAVIPQERLVLLGSCLSIGLLVTFPLLFFRQKLEGAMVDLSLTPAIAIYLGWPLRLLSLLRRLLVGISNG